MAPRVRGAARPLILIADDNTDMREMYEFYLNMSGYHVETAVNGRQAVVKALALSPDVIVLDLQMPQLDGWGAMRELRSHRKTATTPIIILTGHDFKEYLGHSAIAEGATSFVMKPCLPERLALEIGGRLAAIQRPRSASAL